MSDQAESTQISESGRESIARSLEIGGWISLALLVIGSAISMATRADRLGNTVIHAGILALLATPITRLLVAALVFAKAGRLRLLWLCLFSLAVIAASALAGTLHVGK